MPAAHGETNGSVDAASSAHSSALHSAQHHSNRPIGFAAFVSDVRPRLTRPRTDDNPSTAQLAADLTARWLALTADEKQRYQQTEETNAAVLALADFSPSSSASAAAATALPSKQPSTEPVVGLSMPSLSPPPSSPTHFVYDPLNLANIRNVLIRLEESIIFALIERAQFKQNKPIYLPSEMPQFNGLSFLSFFLYETEILHSKVRRYTSPDEHPFCDPSNLPPPILPQLSWPVTIKQNSINVNRKIYDWYTSDVIPAITKPGDDQNYGSAATADITCLQLLSKRIHYGKFVAESKFRSEPDTFTRLILARDIDGLMQLITKPVVEEQVIQRVHLKAATYGGEPTFTPGNSPLVRGQMPSQSNMTHSLSFNQLTLPDTAAAPPAMGGGGGGGGGSAVSPASGGGVRSGSGSGSSGGGGKSGGLSVVTGGVDVMAGSGAAAGKYKISPDVIANIYLTIIQLNKDVQIEYLLQRLD